MAVSMLSPTTTRIATLALRVLTAILLFASLIILLTNTQQFQGPTLHFYDRVGYSYAAVGIFLGLAYSIYQTVCAVIRIKKGSEGNVVFDFYAEKVVSNLLVTAAVAGFVTTGQLVDDVVRQQGSSKLPLLERFVSLSNSSSGIVLVGCIFSSMLSVLCSYALARDDD
ncbi:unnamed protein product [Prunus armeniaca]|uniref:CASP-like protein n=1 Tax=Prunus armeniaca TaxID=36596 RepID=A0A6J5U3K3_PRUAR|nr:unnamed protein product [Prunus armeniaca]